MTPEREKEIRRHLKRAGASWTKLSPILEDQRQILYEDCITLQRENDKLRPIILLVANMTRCRGFICDCGISIEDWDKLSDMLTEASMDEYESGLAVFKEVDAIEKSNDSLTAEIATLKAEVEHYKIQAEQASENNTTLRTHLKAVVEAGERVQTDTDEILYDYVTVYLPDGKKRDDRVAVSLAKIQTAKLSSDALHSALDKAKGAVG